MFAVIQGDKIKFRSTILSRAETYRDEHGGILNELVYRDAIEPDPADRYWILQRGQRIATFAELGQAIDYARKHRDCDLCKRLLPRQRGRVRFPRQPNNHTSTQRGTHDR